MDLSVSARLSRRAFSASWMRSARRTACRIHVDVSCDVIGSGRKSAMSSRLASAICISPRRSADQLHDALIGRKLAALRGVLAGEQPLLLDETVEIGAGDRPGLALVLDESMDDRERAALVVLHQLDRAEQRRRIA